MTLVAEHEQAYLERHRDVRDAVAAGVFRSGAEHYERHGRGEGRIYGALSPAEQFARLRAKLPTRDWPAAVHAPLLCDPTSEPHKYERADAILDLFVATDLTGRSVLDFGCGEGHLAERAGARGTRTCVGFDVEAGRGPPWTNGREGFVLTTDFDEVRRRGPFDLVVLYDVLDHAVAVEPARVIEQVREVAARGAVVKVRCHPWYSRHGSHLYQSQNKAFLNVVFDDDELAAIELRPAPMNRIHSPETYREWFRRAGVEFTERVVAQRAEHVFRTDLFRDRMRARVEREALLDQCFVDYEWVVT